jgi:hypothetical protein
MSDEQKPASHVWADLVGWLGFLALVAFVAWLCCGGRL